MKSSYAKVRHNAAIKAWENRRKNKRSTAAHKAWETMRRNKAERLLGELVQTLHQLEEGEKASNIMAAFGIPNAEESHHEFGVPAKPGEPLHYTSDQSRKQKKSCTS